VAGTTIRWLVPSSWIEQTDPWSLLKVARDRRVHTELMREASRRMVQYASAQVRATVDRNLYTTGEFATRERRFFYDILDLVDESTTLDEPDRTLTLKPLHLLAAGSTDDLQGLLESQVYGRRVSTELRLGSSGMLANRTHGLMRLIDAATARNDLPDRLVAAVLSALEYAADKECPAPRTTATHRRRQIAELIKRAIPYPHPRDIGVLIAHGDSWAMYERSSARRPGRVGVQLSPGLVAPAAQFNGWVEGTLHEALDVVGHLGSPAMKDAARQLGAQGLL
jgi:hypothetical protein